MEFKNGKDRERVESEFADLDKKSEGGEQTLLKQKSALEKYEKVKRVLQGKEAVLVSGLAIAMAAFQFYYNSYGVLQSIKHGALFLSFTLLLIFLIYPINKNAAQNRIVWYDYVLAFLGVGMGLYIFFRTDIFVREGLLVSGWDILIGTIAIIIALEAARRAVGIWMAFTPLLFIVYFIMGKYLPGPLGHFGYSWRLFITRIYLVEEGIFGITQRVALTYVYMFVLFGAFLAKSGAGKLITDLALTFSGQAMGGPAKVAVVASGLMGTISGSAVANVATTGSFTIPLMKKTGLSASMAASVEAVASTGGMIMPPVMGAAAFVMAEFLGIPYLRIMKAAIIPALLYYLSIFIVIHFESIRLGIRGLPAYMLPTWKDVLKRIYLILPVFVIIRVMLTGYTPLFACFLGIFTSIVLSWIRKDTRMGIKKILEAMDEGTRAAIPVCIAATVAGIIVGVATVTAVGQVITYNIVLMSHGIVLFALVFIAVAIIMLTMGLPATAAYIIVATIAAPALVRMGIQPIAAHMFAFYFASMSNITPPVCMASYTAAGIAGASPILVSWKALRMAIAGFVIPFMFVYSPSLLLIDYEVPYIFYTIGTATVGVICLAIGSSSNGLFRPFKFYERIMLIGGGILLISSNIVTDFYGFIILALGFLLNWYRKKKHG